MKPIHSAAVDLGATSGRVLVGTYANARLTLQEVHRFPNAFHYLGEHCYWNLPGLFSEIQTGLKKARQVVPGLASFGIDAWGVDSVLLNNAGRLVFPAHAYRDNRTQPFFEKLSHSGDIEKVFEWTGLQNLTFNTSLQLQEILTNCPHIRELATRCLFLPDYFNYLLSGKQENEISIVSTSQLLDVHSTSLSRDALDFFGIPPEWFSQPALSPQKLGKATAPNLDGVEVVMVPGHDTSCAYDAMPTEEGANDIFLSSGTWSLIGFESKEPVLGSEALANKVSNERLGNGDFRPVKNCLGLWLLEQTITAFSERPRNGDDWAHLIRAAERHAPFSYNLDVTDQALFNPPSMKKAIDRQIEDWGQKPPRDLAGYTRLICDSLGKGHAAAIRSFETMTGRKFERILIVGGGSKNRLLCQATADAAGIPVNSYALEGTAVGNLANQFIAMGAVPDLQMFRQNLAMELDPAVYEPHGQ